jgi:GTP-binding protein
VNDNIVRKAAFLKGAVNPKGFPDWDWPEIAFAGRSNVGKSSALRLMVEKRCKVRISSTPGRTREINFFSVELSDGLSLGFVDLPGFGYAKVPLWKREEWAPLVGKYLEGRKRGRYNLKGVVLFCDLRRGPEEEEVNLLEWLDELKIPAVMAFTKSDKLSKSKRKPALMANRKVLPESALSRDPILFSGKSGDGVDLLWKRLRKMLIDPTAGESDNKG